MEAHYSMLIYHCHHFPQFHPDTYSSRLKVTSVPTCVGFCQLDTKFSVAASNSTCGKANFFFANSMTKNLNQGRKLAGEHLPQLYPWGSREASESKGFVLYSLLKHWCSEKWEAHALTQYTIIPYSYIYSHNFIKFYSAETSKIALCMHGIV